MNIDDIENNYEYDNEGMNELGYVKMRIMYIRLFITLVIFNIYFIYFMYYQIHLHY